MISLTDLPGPGSWEPSGKNEGVEAERELSSREQGQSRVSG